MERTTILTYDLKADDYDRETKSFWDRFPSALTEKFIDNLPNKNLPEAKVVNLGSGPNRDGEKLAMYGIRPVCLDASSTMVQKTIKDGYTSVQADLLKLPIAKKSIEGFWEYTALLHLDRIELPDALNQIYESLVPEGIAAFGFMKGEDAEYRASSGVLMPRLFTYYEDIEILDLLLSTGFKSLLYFDTFKPHRRTYMNILVKK